MSKCILLRSAMGILWGLFFLSMPLSAQDDEVSVNLGRLKKQWQQYIKEKRLSKSDAAKALFSLSKKNKRIFFSRAFKPEKKTTSNGDELWFAKPDKLYISLEGKGVFEFDSCEKIEPFFRKSLYYQTLGSAPYEIKYNNFYILHKDNVKASVFKNRCEALAEKNTFDCPDYTEHSLTIRSKVGPLVLIDEDSHGGGGCGPPYHYTSGKNIFLEKGKSGISDYFKATDLIRALKEDSYIAPRIDEGYISSPKNDLDWLKLLNFEGFAIADFKLRKGRMRIRWLFRNSEDDCGMCPNKYRTLGMDVLPQEWFLEKFKTLDQKKELLFKD